MATLSHATRQQLKAHFAEENAKFGFCSERLLLRPATRGQTAMEALSYFQYCGS